MLRWPSFYFNAKESTKRKLVTEHWLGRIIPPYLASTTAKRL
jgi:hypothetical protein